MPVRFIEKEGGTVNTDTQITTQRALEAFDSTLLWQDFAAKLLTDINPQLAYRQGTCLWSGKFMSALNEVVYKRVYMLPDCPHIKG